MRATSPHHVALLGLGIAAALALAVACPAPLHAGEAGGLAALVEKLGAGPGVITLQLFLTDEGRIKFIEINPRFGGGVPLSIKAGANFPKWILQELTDGKPKIRPDGFKDGLTMLRYDSEVWL